MLAISWCLLRISAGVDISIVIVYIVRQNVHSWWSSLTVSQLATGFEVSFNQKVIDHLVLAVFGLHKHLLTTKNLL